MRQISIVYCPFPDLDSAVAVTKSMVSQKLIACSNIVASESIFNWEGEMKQTSEFVAIMKTDSDKIDKLYEVLEKEHPYEVPAILSWNALANESYGSWVESET
ncbi:MAG TPA: divalent-cation tolerance protein CutA [Caldisericia bacterium]|nr:divalent-cation tolerance protein CutA [Caldisericia bacterium]HPF48888.1 divalent-cation tolerance protein CutA [Caldisericia bacterium]HPI83248.1 divalent-cation tolerance protein CutA [Caldisericia bacterium]HPQ92475.1 divalent-cation tolerance protein CutA [Caldisericia bacterium]HRV74427.1 divalent-cation tolerance protein CutA [Caldisericia bacterium]